MLALGSNKNELNFQPPMCPSFNDPPILNTQRPRAIFQFSFSLSCYSCNNWSISLRLLSLLCWVTPVLLTGTVSERSSAHWHLTKLSVRVASFLPLFPCLSATEAPPPHSPSLPFRVTHLSGSNIHTPHSTLPSSVTVWPDSSSRQALEWRLDPLPERLHDNGPVGWDRDKALPHTCTAQHASRSLLCCTISCQPVM